MTTDIRGGTEPSTPVALPEVREPTWQECMIRVPATVVGMVGVAVILGWALNRPFLSSLGSGTIPVAPSTAVMFILNAIALFCRLHPAKGWAYWIGGGINVAGGMVATMLVVSSLLGIHPEAERLGMSVVDAPGLAPIGHMSLVTAIFFQVGSLSYLASLLSFPTSPWRATLALWLAYSLIAGNSLLILAYLYGTPLFYGGSFIPPAALTCVAFVALGVALLALAVPLIRATQPVSEPIDQASYLFVLTFVFLATGIVFAGFLYFRNYEKGFRAEAEQQLSAIAELKGSELAHWRRERLKDGAILFENNTFSSLARRFLKGPGEKEAQAELHAWLDRYLSTLMPYEAVFLLDPAGRIRLAVTSGAKLIGDLTPELVSELLVAGQVDLRDFVPNDPDREITLALLVPIQGASQEDKCPIGLLVLQIDPNTYLDPFISRWPTSSRTVKPLLVRREGNEVLFLNDRQFLAEAAHPRRVSLGHAHLPVVQAVRGREGIVEDTNSRGVPVIADLRPVPNSPWFMVSLLDVAEVYAPLRERLWTIIAFVSVLLLGAGASVGLVWRQQRIHIYQERLATAEALRRSAAKIEERNAEIERFTYTVSHDLKSPLVTIKTFLGYLREDMAKADVDRIEKDMGYMHTAVDKMRQLLDELLEMSRVGRVVNPPVAITFRELVNEALQAVAGGIAAAGVEVVVAEVAVTLYGDHSRLVEVWQNLIENAVKYMGDQPEPRIEIGVATKEDTFAFYVRDNGIGIDPRYRDKVFGLFDKLDPKSEGSGLGLALVKRIVTLYEGTVWLESAGVGHGASFFFTMPRAVRLPSANQINKKEGEDARQAH